MISALFRTIKTKIINLFDKQYDAIDSTASATTIAAIAATTSSGDKGMSYREFNNTKPLEFDGVRDPITTIRWISNVEGRGDLGAVC